MLATLRQTFWLPRARQTIKILGKPFPAQVHAPLPKERVESDRPFSVTSLDYPGFLLVKNCYAVVKCYIFLFA